MVRIEVDAGEQAGDVGVLRIGGVEFFQQRRGLRDLGGIVGTDVGAGGESGEGGVGWVGGEGGREQSFGVGGASLGQQDVGQRGDGFRVCGVPRESEIAAVGALGGGQVYGGLGDLGGKHDVFGSLGGEVEGGEQLGGGGRGVGGRWAFPIRSSRARARRARAFRAGAASGSWVAVSSSLRASTGRAVRASSRPSATCGAAKSGLAVMAWR